MNENQVNLIRETSRNLLILNRRKHRDDEADMRRSMEKSRITPSTVVSIADKLKTKSMISLTELCTLKNALMDDVTNIEVVLNTHGALRGLVRELSGHDVNKQCAAAGCCCNLALGDSKAGMAVSKAAGAYLVAALDNLTTELAVTCAWTLGNLAGTGAKSCELLTTQGAVNKLAELLSSGNEEVRDAGLYALEHFAYQLKDDLRTEHLQRILQYIPRVDITTTSRLLFILSCHKDINYNHLTEEYILKLIHYLSVSITKYLPNEKTLELVYLLRIFANINSKDIYEVVLKYFVDNNVTGGIKVLLGVDEVSESLLWLLGNMFSCCSGHVFFSGLLS